MRRDHYDDLDLVPPLLRPVAEPLFEHVLGAASTMSSKTHLSRVVLDRGEIDDHGDILIASRLKISDPGLHFGTVGPPTGLRKLSGVIETTR